MRHFCALGKSYESTSCVAAKTNTGLEEFLFSREYLEYVGFVGKGTHRNMYRLREFIMFILKTNFLFMLI